jgi:hypothetical protein
LHLQVVAREVAQGSTRKRQGELRESIDDLRRMMERSRRELELGEHHQEHFRAAISGAVPPQFSPAWIAILGVNLVSICADGTGFAGYTGS